MKSPTVQDASRWIGRVLRDKWRIDARIARGGVGTVYAATHKNNGNHVALKVLHPEFSRDADTRSRFLQEGYAANQVNHPGVVRILDDDVTEEGLAFLVMELLEGELLERRRIRKGGKLPLAEVYELADQLLDVLAAAHDKGIVHRDIKPDNLFVTKEGKLKVLDFGFAQMKTGFRKEQTATGFLLGTPGFMSPEQAVGNRAKVDAQTDIWAVGATLFALLSGQPVHEGESAAEMLVAAANYPARPLARVEPGVPPKLAQVVDRALAFEKANRWPNARAMQVALRTIPGRVALGGNLDSGRRSLPHIERDASAPSSERTVMDRVEQLDERDLDDARPSWEERTVMAEAQGGASRPSGRGVHPADPEMDTVAVPSPAETEPATSPPMTQQLRPHQSVKSGLLSLDSDTSSDSGTVIMENPAGVSAVSGAFSAGAPSSQRGQPFSVPSQSQSFGAAQQGFPVNDPRASRSEDMMFVAGPARPAPPPAQGNRVLVFVAVAVISMLIVIVTGLLVIAASD